MKYNLFFEGLNDSWEHKNKKVTLKELLLLIKNIKVTKIETSLLKDIVLDFSTNKEQIEKIEKSNLKFPILILMNNDDSINSIIDGNHRVNKALKYNLKFIKCKLIYKSNLPKYVSKIIFT